MQRSMRQSARRPCGSPASYGSSQQQQHDKDVLPIELYREARNGAITRFQQQQQQKKQQQQQCQQKAKAEHDEEEDDARCIDHMEPPALAAQQNAKRPSLIDRIRMEKNRVVQRCLVAVRLAEPSRDVFFTQKKQDFADAIEVLQETKRNIQKLTAQVQKFTGAVTLFAGDSSSYAQFGMHTVPRHTFLQASQQIEEKAYAFSDDVETQVIAKINARIVTLEKMHESIVDRGHLQLDVDYAKRKLTIAQQKSDVNQIAERKHALLVAQKQCADATKAITQQLEFVTTDQQPEIQELLTQFGDELLAAAPPAAALPAVRVQTPPAFETHEPEPEPEPESKPAAGADSESDGDH